MSKLIPYSKAHIVGYDGQPDDDGGYRTPVFAAGKFIFKAAAFLVDGIIASAEVRKSELDNLTDDGRVTKLDRQISCGGKSDDSEPGVVLLVASQRLQKVLTTVVGMTELGTRGPAADLVQCLSFPLARVLGEIVAESCAKFALNEMRTQRTSEYQQLDRMLTRSYRLILLDDVPSRWRISLYQGVIRTEYAPDLVERVFDARLAHNFAENHEVRRRWIRDVQNLHARERCPPETDPHDQIRTLTEKWAELGEQRQAFVHSALADLRESILEKVHVPLVGRRFDWLKGGMRGRQHNLGVVAGMPAANEYHLTNTSRRAVSNWVWGRDTNKLELD